MLSINHLGEGLRKLRKGYGMSQKELAKKIGYDYTYIGKVERRQQCPSGKFIDKIMEFFYDVSHVDDANFYFRVGGIDEIIEKLYSNPEARPFLEKYSRLKNKEYRAILGNLLDRLIEAQSNSNES